MQSHVAIATSHVAKDKSWGCVLFLSLSLPSERPLEHLAWAFGKQIPFQVCSPSDVAGSKFIYAGGVALERRSRAFLKESDSFPEWITCKTFHLYARCNSSWNIISRGNCLGWWKMGAGRLLVSTAAVRHLGKKRDSSNMALMKTVLHWNTATEDDLSLAFKNWMTHGSVALNLMTHSSLAQGTVSPLRMDILWVWFETSLWVISQNTRVGLIAFCLQKNSIKCWFGAPTACSPLPKIMRNSEKHRYKLIYVTVSDPITAKT